MAKRRPVLALEQIERELGYSVKPLESTLGGRQRFFSDLEPVPGDSHEIALREYRAHHEARQDNLQGFLGGDMVDAFIPSQDIAPRKVRFGLTRYVANETRLGRLLAYSDTPNRNTQIRP